MILTAKVGTNEELFPSILKLYVFEGAKIADVTYGKGVFWKNISLGPYELYSSDILTGTDLRNLPYGNNSFDAVVLDPPYMHSSKYGTVKDSIARCYETNTTGNFGSHETVMELYYSGISEALRVLKDKSILIVKCQDEICSGKQRLSHIDIIAYTTKIGFIVEDIFVLVQKTIPASRWKHQLHARKNHSYFLVFRKKKPGVLVK